MSTNNQTSGLTLYVAALVNPYKLTMICEELGITYETRIINVLEGEHKSEWYTKTINPNGKLPALTHRRADGTEITVWESGACMQYMIDEFDTSHKLSFPHGTKEYYSMLSWMTWQIASLGPMGGQAVHFLRYAYEHDRYGIQRYVTQSRQLYNVLEKHFSTKSSTWLVGDKFTIADIACFPWVNCAWHEGITIEDYPAVKAWRERIGAREGVKRGMLVPAPFLFTDEFTRNPGTVETRIAIRQGLIPIIKKDVETWFKEPGAGFMEAGPDEATKEQT